MEEPDTAGPPALPAILRATAAELTHLAGVADGLGVCPTGNPEQWQSLDRMSQHLGALASFLAAVAVAVPDCRPDISDALAAVPVGQLVCRLTDQVIPDDAGVAGELELFDA